MKAADFSYAAPDDPLPRRLVIDAVERLTGRETIKRLYLAHQAQDWGQAGFFATSIKALSLDLRYDAARLRQMARACR